MTAYTPLFLSAAPGGRRRPLSISAVCLLLAAAVVLTALVPAGVSYAREDGPPGMGTFTDIDGHWAKGSIIAMQYAGVADVPESGLFHPEAEVTRGQFTEWLARSLELQPEYPSGPESAPFADWAPEGGDGAENTGSAPSSHWPWIAAAAEAGLVSGYPDGRFDPGGLITRLELAVVLGRALERVGVRPEARYFAQFADGDSIPEWGLPAAAAVRERIIFGVFRDRQAWFDAGDNATRAHAITMVDRFLEAHLEKTGLPRPEPSRPVPPGPGPIMAGYYINDANGYSSLTSYGSHLDWLIYWSYHIDEDLVIKGSDSPRVFNWAIDRDRPVIALVHSHFRDVNSRFLNDEGAQHRAVKAIRNLMDKGYSGVNLDFEYVNASDRHNLTEFVRKVAAELRPTGHLVTLSLVAKVGDFPNDDWMGAYDYAALARHADYMVLMTYDYNWIGGRAGPVGPIPWVERVLTYAAGQAPPEKLMLGLPAYGYDWPDGGGRGRALTGKSMVDLAGRRGVPIVYDPDSGESYFRYADDDGRGRTAWFTPAAGLEAKLALVEKYGLAGAAMWRMGQEVPEYWPVIGRWRGR